MLWKITGLRNLARMPSEKAAPQPAEGIPAASDCGEYNRLMNLEAGYRVGGQARCPGKVGVKRNVRSWLTQDFLKNLLVCPSKELMGDLKCQSLLTSKATTTD